MSEGPRFQHFDLLNDEALIEIVTFGEEDGYVPAAVEAALAELLAREASPWTVAATVPALEAKRSRAAERASLPLSWPARMMFLLSAIYILPALIGCLLELRGYQRKSLEALEWMGLGALFWIGVLVLPSLSQVFAK